MKQLLDIPNLAPLLLCISPSRSRPQSRLGTDMDPFSGPGFPPAQAVQLFLMTIHHRRAFQTSSQLVA